MTVRQVVPEQVVPGALAGGVVVDGGMREKRTGQPTDLPLQNRPLSGLAPVITGEVCRREGSKVSPTAAVLDVHLSGSVRVWIE